VNPSRAKRFAVAAAFVSILPASSLPAAIPKPTGIYVLNEASDELPVTSAYAAGLTTSPAYASDVAGHAIFVPIAKILPSVTTWGQFNWDWTYVDTLVQTAVSNGKRFSIELETGYQSSTTYLESLPSGFRTACGANCAPLFDVWTTGGAQSRCISAYIPLPWVPNVQQFWDAAATALAAHLKQNGTYSSLTLVHIPGLSVYDEEVRLPTGIPAPAASDTSVCPDGRAAVAAVTGDASASHWQSLGYSDAAVVGGFKTIAASFARAFPDRYLGYSVFPAAAKGIDFPNLTGDAPGTVAAQLVQALASVAPGRVEIQSDALDTTGTDTEVTGLAAQVGATIGWQANRHGGTGAGCNGGGPGSCNPDGASGPFYQLLRNGAQSAGRYVEVWSADVVAYPLALGGAKSAELYQPNYEGLWWADPPGSESGWGVNIAHQGDILFATWFTYDTDGSGMWLVVSDGAKTGPGTYSGALYRTTGPAFSAVAFDPAQVKAVAVGSATFTFGDENNGTFDYTVNGVHQSKAIVRQVYGSTTPTCAANLASPGNPNYQDLWWNANESGWGVNVTHQGDTLFATWFTYDTNGRGLWIVMPDGAKTGAGTYSGALYRTTGPAFDATPFDPAQVKASQVGSGTFAFASANAGTFSYTVDGVSQAKSITRQSFSLPPTTCE
jgi:hypothetical protein